MKKFLAVNIDTISLNIISSLLMEHTSDFEILTSEKIGEINDIIKKLATDIIIIDLTDPSPQDLKTLGYLSKSHPKQPLLVLTAFETGEIESAIKSIGTVRYFEKPVDFKEIVDVIWGKIERSVGGEIHGISLTSFLQMSEMEKTSCTLRIKTDKKSGVLYLVKGALIAAEAGELKNEAAVFDILSWENPAIEIDDTPTNTKKEIQAPLISILMESAQRKDDKKKGTKSIPPGKTAGAQKKPKKGTIVSSDEKIREIESASAGTKGKPPAPETVPSKIEELKASGKITDASKVLKRQRLITQIVRLSAAVIIIVAVVCLWQFAVRPGLAKKKFNNAVANAESAQSVQEKISILDKYLATGPERVYAVQAETMKRSHAGEMTAEEFDKTIRMVEGLPLDDNFQETAKAAYLKFLEQFPDSPFNDEISRRIDDIPFMMADAEYTRLKNIPQNLYSERLQAYQSYLTKHPDSINADNVKGMMNTLGQDFYKHIKTEKAVCDKNQTWQICILLCQYFLDNWKEHERAGDVTALFREMTDQAAYIKLAEQVEKTGPLSETTETILREYLKEHPDSPVRGTVENQLATITQKKNQEKNWQQLIDYVKNDRNNIFDRIDRLEYYLKQRPPEKHVNDAKDIHAWLLKEKGKVLQQMNQQAEIEKMRKQRELFIGQERKKIISQIQQSGGRYSVIKKDTITDNQTRLTWCMFDSSVLENNCMDYKAAKKYVGTLNTGGYNDWRLPDPTELLVLYNSSPKFPVSDARWYWTSDVFSAAWKEKANTVFQTDAGIWGKRETDLKKCGAVRAVRP